VNRLYKIFRRFIMILPPEMAHGMSFPVFKVLGALPKRQIQDPLLQTEVLGLTLSSPVGLAAGFDKDAKIPKALLKAGFGFVEVGTLTPKPQKGNKKPRLFRLIEDEALINRLGFNNQGFEGALKRLKAFPKEKRIGPLGINIGANKDAANPVADYLEGLEKFFGIADYVTINISSPNTPGLRDLQQREKFGKFLKALKKKSAELEKKYGNTGPALLIKIAPDLEPGQLKGLVGQALDANIDGLIISNTTTGRPEGLKSHKKDQEGGLSGQPLFDKSTALLAEAYKLSGGKLTLIGVGGVASAQQAFEKILAGASLVQLYTGLIFEGPGLARSLNRDLAYLLRSNGFSTVAEAVGKGVKK